MQLPVVRKTASVLATPAALWSVIAIQVVGFLIYLMHQPVALYADATLDDAYFVRSAESILAGNWLGPYDSDTLIKGPGFSYFLVFNRFTGLPITLTVGLLQLLAAFAIAWALFRVLRPSRVWFLVTFTLVLWSPGVVMTRVVRDAMVPHLLILAVAVLLLALLAKSTLSTVLYAVPAGLLIGLFWITREDSVWVVPGLLLLIAIGVWGFWRVARAERWRRAICVAVLAGAALVPGLATAVVNWHQYGVFPVIDYRGASFAEAVSQLDRIEVGPEIWRVPVSHEALEAAFRASPALAELKPYFDGPAAEHWAEHGCDTRAPCEDIRGGWFMWALRDAAQSTGHFSSLKETDRYFTQVAKEIDAGCGTAYRCRASTVGSLPVLTPDAIDAFPNALWRAVRLTAYLLPEDDATASTGSEKARTAMMQTLGRPLATSTADDGFVASEGRTGLRSGIYQVYRVLTPVLAIAGLLALAYSLVFWRRNPARLLTGVSIAFAGLYLSRVALIALADSTMFAAVRPQYLGPAYVLLELACIAAIAAGADTMTAVRANNRATSPAEPTAEPTAELTAERTRSE